MIQAYNKGSFDLRVARLAMLRSLARELKGVRQLVQFTPRVPVTVQVNRDGEPSVDYLVTLQSSINGQALAYYSPDSPSIQWFLQEAVYQEVIATAYEFSAPRLGITRWPTISETANSFLFNVTEGEGGGGPSTVDARVSVIAAVDAHRAIREAVIIERMDDGQWRVAGYGETSLDVAGELDLKVTPTGVQFAVGLDDYGNRFVANLPVVVGQRVRPTFFAGWLYQVTEAGTLPATEPEWWAAEGENASRPLGTARAIAVRYYRPLAHGPIPVEIT